MKADRRYNLITLAVIVKMWYNLNTEKTAI